MGINEMRKTWLVQRLNPPRAGGFLGLKDNPFSFGGGLRNGGLSDEAMDLLRSIFSFDYMGSAEFEWGAVPEALQGLAADAQALVGWQFEIPLADVQRHWTDTSSAEPEGSATIYALARKPHAAEVEKRVRAMAAKDYQLKEATHLPSVLRPSPDASRYVPETAGWLELNNGFAFFIDREMWVEMCDIFGVKLDEAVAS